MSTPHIAPEVAALPVPSREEAYTATMRQLELVLRSSEQTWIVAESYDDYNTAWQIDLVRRGDHGRWVRQRYRFDAQSDTLHFRGEQQINASELAQARRGSKEIKQ